MASEAITKNDLTNILNEVLPPKQQGHLFGTPVTITSTDYNVPSDGYFFVGTGIASGNYAIGVVNGVNMMIVANFGGITYPAQSLFVIKGMVIKATGNAVDAKYYPLV